MEKTMFNVKVGVNTIEHVSSYTSIDCSSREMFHRQSPKERMLISLNNIESNDTCKTDNNILSKESNNMFFIESSGKNYLNPKDCCTIESAIKILDLMETSL